MASSVKALRIGGEGREAEIDGAYFGGHVRPENLAAGRGCYGMVGLSVYRRAKAIT
jgi:hypothetical protein